MKKTARVTILHPDLGIGGAERLIVDAAVGLKARGHSVRIFTNQYNRSHCFQETLDLDITTVVQYIPRSLFGKCHALLAYLKMIIAALYIVIFHGDSDVILSDSVSASQFVLRYFSRAKLVFYCHYPDKLLTQRDGTFKSLYRSIIDSVEERTTGLADAICVNSNFTKTVVQDTFKSLKDRELKVLYPSLNTEFFDSIEYSDDFGNDVKLNEKYVFTSLNRFERKKNVILALDAFACLKSNLSDEEFSQCHLVIAGGYDEKNQENIEHYGELETHRVKLGIPHEQITFLRSPTDKQKVNLIRRSRAILYTPDREHFGIVPVEAMYLGTPVIAVNTGGPLETVRDNETGFLVNQTAEAFAEKMIELLKDEKKYQKLSKEGPKRVLQHFGFEAFSKELDKIILSVF
uniref:Alpha-1,3/1,6-mannosyltransferase ALG2 n=1 Tax=Caenorhabditis tropicalis TaxID=1561998 RepID=A0A1I7TSZ1_9PELO